MHNRALLLNEVPENIENTFSELGLNLLPHSRKDFKTSCDCPDYANPCKHIAGVYYLVASQLDQNPFLLFELRGLSKIELYHVRMNTYKTSPACGTLDLLRRG